MKVVVTGASGLIGSALVPHLREQGHEVLSLVRRTPQSRHQARWDPDTGRIDVAALQGTDAVVHLAGAGVGDHRWTASYKRTFTDSRVATTRTLAEAVAASDRKPAFLAQNGVAGYGDRGDAPLTEESAFDADTFMGRVTRAWQDATTPAVEAGARVVVMRTSVVLDRRGGALKPLLLVFKAGVGGPVGSGEQYFSTISLRDWVRAATHLGVDDDASGVYNLSAPEPLTNAEFGKELGRMLHRPAVTPVPAWAVKTVVGAVSSELLSSTRVEPARLLEEGFVFEHPTLNEQLAAALT